ncbi:GNAT family N-acetyltransferase [Candidatus Poribacteria bacterium]|nr:GNAT family N-acetyltransferase [Candidatus Poribacteria bacterium]MBT5532384.1 GNAT family N-acetyltransferase [Candidatus Poribacteria bacterium]MBT7096395.1 GNAT family N-acetyltransferase [Candidatus Poribacteria bacterium]MBT7804209.1 GNAT family N-acetyltransferase [Candidatus Poribacteria bacterium]
MDISRLQAYLRHSAGAQYETVHAPGLTMFFHATDDMRYLNYAIPDADWGASLEASLPALRREFEARSRLPRFEFVEEYAPALTQTLAANGYREEYRGPSMVCVPGTLVAASEVAGLTIERVDAHATEETLRELVCTQRQGFGGPETSEPNEGDMAYLRTALQTSCAFLARLDAQAVGAGTLTPPHAGLSELGGVATLEPYRRRGIATAVTAAAAAYAFESGLEAVCLSAGDAGSTRVYERAGFRVIATMLAYSLD